MRVKIISISPELLCQLFAGGHHPGGYTVIENPLPADSKIVEARMRGYRYQEAEGRFIEGDYLIDLTVQSETFDEVGCGAIIPTLTTIFRRDA